MYCKYHVEEQENKKENIKDAQKDDTLQPITKVNSKLDKELQEWEENLRRVVQMTEADEKKKKKWSPLDEGKNKCKRILV